MKKMYSWAVLIVCTTVFFACNDEDLKGTPPWAWGNDNNPDPPEGVVQKSRYIWIDACANFPDYANSRENIRRDLQKVKETGFTDIVVDVRPTMGDVLFKTEVVAQVKKLDVWLKNGNYDYFERTAIWDYLQAFIDIGHELGLKVNASINTFVGGNLYSYGLGEQGMLFRDANKKNWATSLNTTSGIVNVMDLDATTDPDNSYGTRFLNPANDEVQGFVLDLLGDLAKYDLDGIFLDRCRYDDFSADFSEVSRQKFEEYIGETVENFPEDIIIPGTASYPLAAEMPKYFKKWMEFRVKVIHDFMVKAKNKIKAVNPDVKLGVYVGGWYSTYYEVGVNWASPRYNTAAHYPEWATPAYQNFGYADQLDFMLIGAYAAADRIYGSGEWTVQGFCKNARQLLMEDVKFAGGPDVGNGTGWTNGGMNTEVTQTVDACINAADGYFVFDIIHVKEFNYWDALKTGIDNYLASLKEDE